MCSRVQLLNVVSGAVSSLIGIHHNAQRLRDLGNVYGSVRCSRVVAVRILSILKRY
jgi:hypothetical protein